MKESVLCGEVTQHEHERNLSRYIDQCVATGRVWTSRGFKPINDLSYADQLLGGDGQYHDITRILEHNYEGDLIEITSATGQRVRCTPTQQYLVCRTYRASEQPTQKAAEYMEASEILEGDHIMMKSPDLVKDMFEWSEDDCFVLGLLIASYFTTEMTDGKFVTLDEGAFVSRYLTERSIPFERCDDDVRWRSHKMFPFTTRMIRSTADGCVVIPEEALHLPLNKLRRLFEGLSCNFDCKNYEYVRARLMPREFMRVANIQISRASTIVYDVVMKDSDSYMTDIGLAHHGLASLPV